MKFLGIFFWIDTVRGVLVGGFGWAVRSKPYLRKVRRASGEVAM